MVAKRDEWMSVEDFLALDRENLDQKYEDVILPPFEPFRGFRKRNTP